MIRGRGGIRGRSIQGRGARGGRSSSSFRREFSTGPPQSITEVGFVTHYCEDQLVCESILNKQVPFFNGRIFLDNKQEIGKIDEVLGPLNKVVYIDSRQITPLSKFLPKPEAEKKAAMPKQVKAIRGGRCGLRGSISLPRRGVFSRGTLSRGKRGV